MSIVNDENALMEQYGIVREKRYIYRYKTYEYSSFQDALNYAKLDSGDDQASVEEEPGSSPVKTSG